jgi:UDP-glucose 4-epimerase
MPKILITGASGYLGSTLLLYAPIDWEIVGFDLTPPNVKVPQNFKFIKGDITSDLPSTLLNGVDAVLHLAAVKGSDMCRENPLKTIEVNVVGTRKLLKAALRSNARLIFASTYWVYGDSADPPFTEETLTKPSEIYGLSKAASEIEIAESGIDYVILRFANIFGMGSGARPEEVIFNFIKSAFEGKPIILHNGGSQRLDFIDVEDVCKCVWRIINDQRISRCILNVGSGRPRSIASVARIVKDEFERLTGRTVTINTLPAGEPVHDRWVSIKKVEEKLGELRLKPFEQSIRSYIGDYQRRFQ